MTSTSEQSERVAIFEAQSLVDENEKLEEVNQSLRTQNRFLKAGLIGLATLSICSTALYCKEKSSSRKIQQNNAALRENMEHFEDKASTLSCKVEELKPYKELVDSIKLFYPELVGAKSDTTEIVDSYKNNRGQKKWDDACKVLGIDIEKLENLKGITR